MITCPCCKQEIDVDLISQEDGYTYIHYNDACDCHEYLDGIPKGLERYEKDLADIIRFGDMDDEDY